MALKITFGNQKGGTGKTTLSVIVATALSQEPFNYNLCVCDCDNQKSIVNARLFDMDDFQGIAPYEVYNYNVPTLESNIKKLNDTHDIIIIDTAGKLDNNVKDIEQQEIRRVLNIVDVLFIPFVHGNYTLHATIKYLKSVIEIRDKRAKENRPLKIIGLLNMYDKRLNTSKDLQDEIDDIKRITNIDIMKVALKPYTLFRTANTIDTLYKDREKKDYLNAKLFIKELHKILTNG